jgi:hypothetical protein
MFIDVSHSCTTRKTYPSTVVLADRSPDIPCRQDSNKHLMSMLPLQLTCFTASQNRCMSEEFQGERGRERTLIVSRDCWGMASIRITSFVKSCTVRSMFMGQSLAETRAHLYVLQCENLKRHPVPYSPCKSPCRNLPGSFRDCSIHYAARVALISSACWEGYSIVTCKGSPLRPTVRGLTTFSFPELAPLTTNTLFRQRPVQAKHIWEYDSLQFCRSKNPQMRSVRTNVVA